MNRDCKSTRRHYGISSDIKWQVDNLTASSGCKLGSERQPNTCSIGSRSEIKGSNAKVSFVAPVPSG